MSITLTSTVTQWSNLSGCTDEQLIALVDQTIMHLNSVLHQAAAKNFSVMPVALSEMSFDAAARMVELAKRVPWSDVAKKLTAAAGEVARFGEDVLKVPTGGFDPKKFFSHLPAVQRAVALLILTVEALEGSDPGATSH